MVRRIGCPYMLDVPCWKVRKHLTQLYILTLRKNFNFYFPHSYPPTLTYSHPDPYILDHPSSYFLRDPCFFHLLFSSLWCTSLLGEKWAANLWVWNGPRQGYWKKNIFTGKNEPIKLGSSDEYSHHDTTTTKPLDMSVTAVFTSMDVEGAALYWEDTFWADLIVGRDIVVNSFGGHKWNVRKDGEVITSWVIAAHKANQKFQLHSKDL